MLAWADRLGVGAKIPDAVAGSSSKDAAKLRGYLVGSKRSRDDNRKNEAPSKLHSDDEDDVEESRGGAIQKKIRVDPFATPKKSKGKGNKMPLPESRPQATSSKADLPRSSNESDSSDSSEEEEGTGRFVLAPGSSPATSNTSSLMGPPASVIREDTPATSVATPVPSSPTTSLVCQ
jgi:hypothetical protein